ncbi:MAG: hypothetical protein ACRECR_01125 [Thermoplasmata archaeon]
MRAIREPELGVLKIRSPDSARQLKRLEAERPPAESPIAGSGGVQKLNIRQFRSYVTRHMELPVTIVDRGPHPVTELIGGEVLRRSAPPPAGEEVVRALGHFEPCLATIDMERAPASERRVRDTARFEGLLHR